MVKVPKWWFSEIEFEKKEPSNKDKVISELKCQFLMIFFAKKSLEGLDKKQFQFCDKIELLRPILSPKLVPLNKFSSGNSFG